MCTCRCLHAYRGICAHRHLCAHMGTGTRAQMCTHVQAHTHAHVHKHTPRTLQSCAHVQLHKHTYLRTHMHIQACNDTHSRTQHGHSPALLSIRPSAPQLAVTPLAAARMGNIRQAGPKAGDGTGCRSTKGLVPVPVRVPAGDTVAHCADAPVTGRTCPLGHR